MTNNTRALVEITIGFVFMAGSIRAGSTVINTCPAVINSPGDYVLSADLICGGGLGISILSSNVTLNLQGHSITAGGGATTAIVVNPQFAPLLEHVRILGPGLITNNVGNVFGTGVSLLNVSHSEVSGLTVRGVRGFGIAALGNAGFITTDLTITANSVTANAGDGISLVDILSSTISANEATGNTANGIRVVIAQNVTGSANLVSHNICNGNTADGVAIDGVDVKSDPAKVQNNVTSGNGQYGIVVFPPAAATVINNSSFANQLFDLFDKSPGCTGNKWVGNKFLTANQSCIH